VLPGGTFSIVSAGWKALSQVVVTLFSTPVQLGTMTADASGTAQGSFTVPADTPAGAHTIELTGTDPADAARTVNLTMTVTTSGTSPGTPTGTGGTSGTSAALPLTGASSRDLVSAALLLLAAGFFLLGRRYRHQPTER
jgi:LPXTG-motif cell wall-anchored protein